MKLVPYNYEEKQTDAMAKLYHRVWRTGIAKCKERLARHQTYNGFKSLLMVSERGQLLGFAYGYKSSPGQYYHDLLATALIEEDRYWLNHSIELVELVVDVTFRGKGIGRKLAQSIIEDVNCYSALLTTQQTNQPAISLYIQLN